MKKSFGGDLLSRESALQVPSALTGLTTGFEMLPGVPPPLQSPKDFYQHRYVANSSSIEYDTQSTGYLEKKNVVLRTTREAFGH